MKKWSYLAAAESATEALGQALARVLEEAAATPGDPHSLAAEERSNWIIALVGPLGAGKTRLVQAVASALGVDRRAVGSPTFILLQEYPCRVPLYHFDAYRLHGADEFLDLGVEEYFSRPGVCLVEWADRVSGCLPADRLVVTIEITGPNERRFHFEAVGAAYEPLLGRLAAAMAPASK